MDFDCKCGVAACFFGRMYSYVLQKQRSKNDNMADLCAYVDFRFSGLLYELVRLVGQFCNTVIISAIGADHGCGRFFPKNETYGFRFVSPVGHAAFTYSAFAYKA